MYYSVIRLYVSMWSKAICTGTLTVLPTIIQMLTMHPWVILLVITDDVVTVTVEMWLQGKGYKNELHIYVFI